MQGLDTFSNHIGCRAEGIVEVVHSRRHEEL